MKSAKFFLPVIPFKHKSLIISETDSLFIANRSFYLNHQIIFCLLESFQANSIKIIKKFKFQNKIQKLLIFINEIKTMISFAEE